MSTFPTEGNLKWVPITKENKDILSCPFPTGFDLKKVLKDKTVAITAIPICFSPICSGPHVPGFLKHLEDLKSKGVDKVIVLSANDPFVMSAWGKALGYTDDENYFMFVSDIDGKLSAQLGEDFILDMSAQGFGQRLSRYSALVKDGEIIYLGNEKGPEFTELSSVETILEKL
ncbi:peroxiredoxin Ahp1p [[Candida] jaroonii]|uniref:Peroxiredoxin Ahp1p n=1 Tax=[Candida] jaroonii TaxID=467808 RepID=A0ACA9YFD6_9ASCO|nr:peroxiredoxin Ahp1p [[Candida] jaroonii]